MKKLLLLVLVIIVTGCEDVISVDLETAAPRLVIDANILWQKGTAGNEQRIKLTTSTDYYSTTIPPATGALVYITNSANTVFTFTEVPNTGEYVCANFVPVVNETYTLTVQYDGKTYKATETLLATPTIDSVEQTTVQGVGGDIIQVKFFFLDNGLENNNYLVTVFDQANVSPDIGVIQDEFFQGNQMFGFYSTEDLAAGHQLTFTLQGISLRYHNYMNKLINIIYSGGNPFATPPATLRGNIVNQNNPDDYPFGYFHLSEIDTRNYTVE